MDSVSNNFQNIGHVTTTKWKEQPKGENNDCYWNIAANSLDSGASNAEIASVMNEIIELNAQKDENGNYDTVLLEDKEVLMPVDQTIKQANSALEGALETYQNALSEYENLINSLENPQDSAQALEKAKENIKSEQENLANLKNSLLSLQEEYKNAYQDAESLKEYQNMLDSIDEKIDSKNLEVEQLKVKEQEAIKAHEPQEAEEDQGPQEVEEDQGPQEVQETQGPQEAEEGQIEVKTNDREIVQSSLQKNEPEIATVEEQLADIQANWQQAQDEQGLFGKAINGVKNLFKTKYSSKKINSEVQELLTRYENGETLSQEELAQIQEKIDTYKGKQNDAVERTTTFGAIFTGGLAGTKAGSAAGAALGSVVPGAGTAAGAVVGGICGFIAGAITGAFVKTGLKQVENVTDDVKGNSFQAQELKHDALSGAKSGGFSGATSGLTAGAKTFKEASEFALSEGEAIKVYDVVDENGNVVASFNDQETALSTQTAAAQTTSTGAQTANAQIGNPQTANASNNFTKLIEEKPLTNIAENAEIGQDLGIILGNNNALMLPEDKAMAAGIMENIVSAGNIENAAQLENILTSEQTQWLSETSGLSVEECLMLVYARVATLFTNIRGGG